MFDIDKFKNALSLILDKTSLCSKTYQYSDDKLERIAKDLVYLDWSSGTTISFGANRLYKVDTVFEGFPSFYAVGLTSRNGSDPILACRGTQNLGDWLSDAHPRGVGYDQFVENEADILRWLRQQKAPVSITGHSLGGALAQSFAVSATVNGIRLKEVQTFNSPGIARDIACCFRTHLCEKVIHHIAVWDFVSLAGDAFINGVPLLYYFPGTGKKYSIIDKHCLPLTVDSICDGGRWDSDKLRTRPDGLTSQQITIDELNSPMFHYTGGIPIINIIINREFCEGRRRNQMFADLLNPRRFQDSIVKQLSPFLDRRMDV